MQSNDDFRKSDLDKIMGKGDGEKTIFDEIGVGHLPPEEKGVLLGNILRAVEARTMERILTEMSEEEVKEMEAIDPQNQEAFEEFLSAKTGYERIFAEEAAKEKQELLIKYGEK